jgi:hypothetical protein
MKDLLGDVIFAATVILVVMIMSGCETIGASGDLVSAFGRDVRTLSDASRSTVKDYSEGL